MLNTIQIVAYTLTYKTHRYDSFSAAWSLGRLIHMMPDDISSAYDKDGNEMPDDFAVFILVMEKNSVKYIEDGGRCRLRVCGLSYICCRRNGGTAAERRLFDLLRGLNSILVKLNIPR